LEDDSIDALHVRYEDYGADDDATMRGLLEFLELPDRQGSSVIFLSNKGYGEFYSPEQRRDVWQYLQEHATAAVLSRLETYYSTPG
jgi:hypothetical protein